MGCGKHYEQLEEINKGLDVLMKAGMGKGNPAYEALWKMRGATLGKLTRLIPTPRLPSIIKLLTMLSPGQLKVFFDNEVGWLAEGTPAPGEMPVVRRISHEQAVLLLQEKPPSELVHKLLKPETYFGE